jgi:hypothetical protein
MQLLRKRLCGARMLIAGILLFAALTGVMAQTTAGCVTTFKNPFPNCKFAWGSISSHTAPLSFQSVWIGGENNGGLSSWSATATNSSCGGCNLAKTMAATTNNFAVFYTYFIGFQAKNQGGLGDCNTKSPPNLCTNASAWIRANRPQLINAYGQYAKAVYAASPNKPTIWWLEGDFVQYSDAGQVTPLSYVELGQLAHDIACAIKTNEPNAIVAMNHSPWITNTSLNQFWENMGPEIDMCWLQAPGDQEVLNNSYADNGRWDSLSVHIKHRPIMAETSYGSLPGTRGDGWTTTTAAQINTRIAEGAIAVLFNQNNYSTTSITALNAQLNATMCSYSPTGSGISLWQQGGALSAAVPKIIRSGNAIICVNVGPEANIFSSAGKLVLHQKVPASGAINVSSLSKGVYLAKAGPALLKFVR